MKRKSLITILAAACIMAGCAQAQNTSVAEKPAEAVTQEKPEETTVETPVETPVEQKQDQVEVQDPEEDLQTVEEPAEEGPTEEELAQVPDYTPSPVLITDSIYLNEWDDSGDYSKLLVSSFDEIIRLTDESAAMYPSLSQLIYDTTKDSVEQTKQEIQTELPEVQMMRDEGYYPDMSFSNERTYYSRRVDSKVLSLMPQAYTYTGGAHGYTGTGCLNYDVAAQEGVPLSDVVTDLNAFTDKVIEILNAKYPPETFFDEYENTVRETIAEGMMTWFFDPDGIRVVFNPYEIAAYASGAQAVTVPYSSGLIADRYLPDEGQGYIISFPLYESQDFDLNGDGTLEEISVYAEKDTDDYIQNVQVLIGGELKTIENVWVFSVKPYYVRTSGGKSFLLLRTGAENDYQVMTLYDISNGDVREVGSLDGSPSYYETGVDGDWFYYMLTDPDLLHLSVRFDLLSTYSATKTFRIGDDGQFSSDEEFYYLTSDGFVIKSSVALNVQDPETGENIGTPGGSSFRLLRTDGQTFVDAYLNDEKIVRLYVEYGEDGQMVDGKPIWDAFEELFFAG